MKVERTHHIDSDEPDSNGLYGFYYEYDIYRFTEDNVTLIARSYIDTKSEVHFLRIERSGGTCLLSNTDRDSPICLKAIEHLKKEGKIEFKWLSSEGVGYSRIPTTI